MMDAIFNWNTFWWMLMLIYIPISLALVALVLLQQGKGGGLAGALGGGGGDNVFGTKSAQTMPVKLTYVGAAIFLTLAIILSVVSGYVGKGDAPELANEVGAAGETASGPTNELDALGLGTGIVNKDATTSPEETSAEDSPAEDPAKTSSVGTPIEVPTEVVDEEAPTEVPATEEVTTDAAQ